MAVNIEATKDGVKFSCNGDIGNGSVTLRSHTNVEKPELNVDIELSEPVTLTFSLKYLVNFCKAAALSSQVKICLSSEVPLLVEYNLSGSSYLRFYLAPKVRSLSPRRRTTANGEAATDWRRGVDDGAGGRDAAWHAWRRGAVRRRRSCRVDAVSTARSNEGAPAREPEQGRVGAACSM